MKKIDFSDSTDWHNVMKIESPACIGTWHIAYMLLLLSHYRSELRQS